MPTIGPNYYTGTPCGIPTIQPLRLRAATFASVVT
jgi:hypothetical protein